VSPDIYRLKLVGEASVAASVAGWRRKPVQDSLVAGGMLPIDLPDVRLVRGSNNHVCPGSREVRFAPPFGLVAIALHGGITQGRRQSRGIP